MQSMKTIASMLSSYMRSHEREIVDFLATLVSIPSTTYHEEEAVRWFADQLRAFGYDEVHIDEAGNCLGRVGRGTTVVLCDAHIDTVEPGDAAEWGFDPLTARIKERTISGRGVIDDKGPLTALAVAGKAIKELGLDDEVTFWVSASIAEEDIEGSCVRAMMEKAPFTPDAVIVAESSDGHIIRGHKGRALIKMEVTGKTAHAAEAHLGENALIKALPLIKALDEWDDLPSDPFLGMGTIEVTTVICDTPSLNTIPGKVTVIADRRIAKGETQEELLTQLAPFLKLGDARAAIDTEQIMTYTGYKIEQLDYFPSWVMEESHPVIQAAKAACEAITGTACIVGRWNFCTNATYLCGMRGIPSVGYGPGDHSLCHSDHEILSFDDLTEAAAVYAAIALSIARTHYSQ